MTEKEPLLPAASSVPGDKRLSCFRRPQLIIWSTLFFAIWFVLAFRLIAYSWRDPPPEDAWVTVNKILSSTPVIDGHIDLPILVRELYANNVTAFDLNESIPGHVDIPRLRKGKVGGFFWSVYVGCPGADGPDFVNATWRVRDTLEQIDVSRMLIEKYSDTFQWAPTSREIKHAIKNGKIASILGVEGAHQIGNSIAVLRQFYSLGVRYMTLTHLCHNAFADSGGFLKPFPPLHGGLSPLGYKLIDEMNRLGILVDLSHTSDDTAVQALNYSRAPLIWSHSSARGVHGVARNVPDFILELIAKGGKDAVVMVNFSPDFVAPEGEATVEKVADHVEHLAAKAGRDHVGIGSDYDGIGKTPEGLEDVSKYPVLFAELYNRGWSKNDLIGLGSGNLLRVFEGAERVAKHLQSVHTVPVMDIYDKRPDLPVYRERRDL